MLMSAALVLLMTPGLAFFYGGMVRSKNVLNMIMMSVSAMSVVAVLWVLYGFSIAFGADKGGLIGDPAQFFGLRTLITGFAGDSAGVPLAGTIPATVFVAFQAMFAIITVALISGAVADRLRFGPWLVFCAIWVTVVYFPVAHWVWGGGWIGAKLEAIDFAGGTAVHINSGAAALALALVVGTRTGWPKAPWRPHNLPLVMLGAALLWFGWFGFNAGSAAAADGVAGVTFVTTLIATAAAMPAWLLVEKIRDGKPTSLGAASGIVAGLVAITPSCSSVNVFGALAIGAIAGAVCALAVSLKFRLGYDDSLDVVGIHVVGGLLGTVLIGIFAAPQAPAGVAGLLYGGGLGLLGRQTVGAVAVLSYSFVIALVIAVALRFTIGLRATREAEAAGMDESEHAETAYDFAAVGGTARSAVKEGMTA
ncbi:ammonium transporter [Nocardia donostiensis]|uniref:Ammonium transporter n=1 Tax=Nocardia donostiensis TaxID=1538463 RepID=A0A1W0AXK7_9NOCA|nr:ammonium transporter [Nocardia donostiensis]ONM49410.1 ammonia channel protein [Nocardia donostiensis]OQS14964.1 ammonia channel protein [Nocardia donostiensis]OQS21913.1 ammonia channel protein [Nocardia donostiensis]